MAWKRGKPGVIILITLQAELGTGSGAGAAFRKQIFSHVVPGGEEAQLFPPSMSYSRWDM